MDHGPFFPGTLGTKRSRVWTEAWLAQAGRFSRRQCPRGWETAWSPRKWLLDPPRSLWLNPSRIVVSAVFWKFLGFPNTDSGSHTLRFKVLCSKGHFDKPICLTPTLSFPSLAMPVTQPCCKSSPPRGVSVLLCKMKPPMGWDSFDHFNLLSLDLCCYEIYDCIL